MSEVASGVEIMNRHIANYAAVCGSDAQIVLLGYAQGALIVSDVFQGSDMEQVVAAAAFSSPTALFDQDYAHGTSRNDGMFATARAALNVLPDRFRSYCDQGDYMCASNYHVTPEAVHTKTVRHYMDDAVEFFVKASKGNLS